MDRRHFLTAVSGTVVGLAGCSSGRDSETGSIASPTDSGSLPQAIGLDPIATGLTGPLDVGFAPDVDRRYIAQQEGTVRVHEETVREAPLLDLRDTVVTGFEQGLLGIALHPDFETNRRLFVRYSAPRRDGTPSEYSHTFVLSEFQVTADGRGVRPDSERTVLEIPQPQANHNAGSIAFGPDGYLYIGVGDGGAGGDQGTGHAEDWYDAVGGGNGQDVTANRLGSILRIDVDNRDDGLGYAVPDDNPLVGRAGYDEQYAWGFRNPWRLAFDGDDLYAGDVGQNAYEEIDLVERGGNYGWNVREGRHCYQASSCPDTTPDDVRGGEQLREPVIEYPHSGDPVSGISVITGNVYRGSSIPELAGAYVFGDFRAGGELFVAERTGDQWPTRVLSIADSDATALNRLRSIRRDDEGELYVLGVGAIDGGLYRVTAA
jgi:glucose/arabinose dehydrogenase